MFEKIGRFLDVSLLTAGTLVGAAMVAVAPIFVDDLGGTWTTVIVLGGIVLGLGTAINSDHQRRELKKRIGTAFVEGQADQVVLLDNILSRAVERLHEIQSAASDPDRHAAHRALVIHITGSIAGYYEASPLRVNYYRLVIEDGAPRLRIFERTASASRDVLDDSTPEGALILQRVLGGDDVYCADLQTQSTAAAHVREPRRNHQYRCFASVVVRSDKDGFGMLSANTDLPHGLPPVSVQLLSVLGGMLALGEALTGEIEPQRVEDRDVLGV